MNALRIGMIEDDPHQSALLSLWLQQAGHEVTWFASAAPFFETVHPGQFQLLLLDWNLPEINGDVVLEWVRSHLGWDIGVIFVSARNEVQDVAYVLTLGADDYVAKPVRQAELITRIAALARRLGHAADSSVVEAGPYRFDTVSHRTYVADAPVDLTRKEFELALSFFQHLGEALSREYLLRTVWGHKSLVDTRTVDTHVGRLKRKLGLSPEQGWILAPVHGIGYRLDRCGGDTANLNAE